MSSAKMDWHRMIKSVLWGVLLGEAVTVLLLLLFSVVMTAAGLPLIAADWLSAISFGAGAFAGGMLASSFTRERGLLTGVLCGGTLIVLLILIGTIFSKMETSLFLLIKAASGLLLSMAGGVLGVNRKSRRIKY